MGFIKSTRATLLLVTEGNTLVQGKYGHKIGTTPCLSGMLIIMVGSGADKKFVHIGNIPIGVGGRPFVIQQKTSVFNFYRDQLDVFKGSYSEKGYVILVAP